MTIKTSDKLYVASITAMLWLISVAIVPMIVLPTSQALAVSNKVKNACKADYFAHCSNHALGSQGLSKCMRAVGKKLSKPCVKALASAGRVSKSEMARYAKHTR